MIFDDRYEVFLADTREAMSLHYHLRYQVYHVETGWESDKHLVGGKLERDQYDAFSKHFLVRDRLTREWAGGMRLVVSGFNELPLARVSQLDRIAGIEFDQSHCVEVSRLFVLPDYRGGRRYGEVSAVKKRTSASYFEVMLGLIRAARSFGLHNGLKSWYFLVEPGLARSIQRLGVDLYCCGPEVDYRGIRRPYYGEVSSCFDRILSAPSELSTMFSRKEAYRSFSRSFIEPPSLDAVNGCFGALNCSGMGA